MFKIEQVRPDILLITVPGTELYCRVMSYQKSIIREFFEGGRDSLHFTECLFDVDDHYCDIKITRLASGKVRVVFSESDKWGTYDPVEFEVSFSEIAILNQAFA